MCPAAAYQFALTTSALIKQCTVSELKPGPSCLAGFISGHQSGGSPRAGALPRALRRLRASAEAAGGGGGVLSTHCGRLCSLGQWQGRKDCAVFVRAC